MRALVVDDSAAMRKLLAAQLIDRGYEVRTTGSGETALEQHRRQPFDMMLVDWTLPGMTGLDLCRAIRADPGGEDVVILVITGRNQPADLHAVLDAGASDYVAKPVDPDVLSTRLLVAARQADAAQKKRRGLENAEEAFRRLVEAAPDAILVLRDDNQVAYGNPRLVRFLGFDSAAQLVGQPLRQLIHPEDPISTLDPRDGPAAPQEVRWIRRDKSVVTGEAVTVRVSFDGRPARLAIVRDISERKDMQARLLLADRMASVGTLAASVAHELNNPLAYVLSNLRLSREELDQPTDAERLTLIKMQLDEAGHGARRMRDILRDLMTFASGSDDSSTPAEQTVDINELLSSCVNMCWNEIRHRARLSKDFGDCPEVKIDQSRGGQVFLNLLINAAQSMDEARAAENVIEISTQHLGEMVAITITDTGRGIEPEDMPRIFEAFFTTKTTKEGAGLGLSIAQNIVTRIGGRIEVESTPGKGSTFTVFLPTAPTVTRSVTPKVALHTTETSRVANVLVVDDEELVGRSIRRALRKHDVQVITTGRDAVRLLCGSPAPEVDIVFCDLMMPEVSGIDVFDAVSKAAPDLAERFVFMTGGAFTPRARRFLESVQNRCMEKPFDLTLIRSLTVDAAARRA